MLLMNELGEFVEADPPDHDERRAKAYRSCIEIDPRKFRGKMSPTTFGRKPVERKPKPKREPKVYKRVCKWCDEIFETSFVDQFYCCEEHRREAYNKRRREANAERRARLMERGWR